MRACVRVCVFAPLESEGVFTSTCFQSCWRKGESVRDCAESKRAAPPSFSVVLSNVT